MKYIIKLNILTFILLFVTVKVHSQTYTIEKIGNYSFSSISDFVAYDNELYFGVITNARKGELWRTNGTEAGTQLVKRISDTNTFSTPNNFKVFQNKLYFSANDEINGRELWVSDGTAQGTFMLKDIAFNGESFPFNFIEYKNKLYFSANDGLWVTDGTNAGTTLVKDIFCFGFVIFNNQLFFTASDDTNGGEIWVSDGTTFGTQLLKDVNPNGDSWPSEITIFQNQLFFIAENDTYGDEIWKSDGTSQGTVLLKDINPNGSAFPLNLTVFNNLLLFRAFDNVNGTELWKSDGTTNGTTMLKDINPTGHSSPLEWAIEYKGELFFKATDGQLGNELWKTDGTSSGTILVKDINDDGDGNPEQLTTHGELLFFDADDGQEFRNYELWNTDGTTNGTTLVRDFSAGGGSFPEKFKSFNQKLFFFITDDAVIKQLWYLQENNNACPSNYSLEVSETCTSKTYNNNFATPSGELPGFSCISEFAHGDTSDVWFSVIVPPIGQITIETSQVFGGISDMVMQVYSGTCGNLISVACNDDSNSLFPKVELDQTNGITAGEELFIRLIAYESNETGDFEICTYAPCGCNGQVDNSPPTIDGYNPDAAWIDNGWWDTDTFNILQSDYAKIRDSFLVTDIILSDLCLENLVVDILPRFLHDIEPINGNCYQVYGHIWEVIDPCRRDTVRDTLYVEVICDLDIDEISNTPFVDTTNLDNGNPDDYRPGDTILVASCSDLSAYINWEPKIGEFGLCDASARSKIKKRPTSSAFSSFMGNTNIVKWVWELELGCSEVANESHLYQIILFFSCTATSNCKTEHIIDDNSLNTGNYLAEQTIVSSAVIKTDSSVVFRAGSSITLQENFHAMQGSSFIAEISPVSCENEALTRNKKDTTNVKSTLAFSKIYPNPATQQITVEYRTKDKDIKIKIYSLDGKEMGFNVLSRDNLHGHQKMVINISNFPKGFYYLTLIGKETLLTEKIIILE